MKKILYILVCTFVFAGCLSLDSNDVKKAKYSTQDLIDLRTREDTLFPSTLQKLGILENDRIEEGLYVHIEKEGDGAYTKNNENITVTYKGYLIHEKLIIDTINTLNPKLLFDQTEEGNFFNFTLGVKSVITSWDRALVNKKVGTKLVIYTKSQFAYGQYGIGSISPYSSLLFKVEIIN